MIKLLSRIFQLSKSNSDVMECVYDEHDVITRNGKSGESEDVVIDGQIMIPTRDITHYLVQEFEVQDSLKTELKRLEEKLEMERVKTTKYNASLVIVEKYKTTIDELNNMISELKEKIEKEKSLHLDTTSQLEVLKVERIKKLEDFNEAKREAKEELLIQYITVIKLHKGTLSKQKAIELLENMQQ